MDTKDPNLGAVYDAATDRWLLPSGEWISAGLYHSRAVAHHSIVHQLLIDEVAESRKKAQRNKPTPAAAAPPPAAPRDWRLDDLLGLKPGLVKPAREDEYDWLRKRVKEICWYA